MVNENFIEYEKIFLKKPSEISVLSHTSGKGILFVHRTKIESIGGYDTFYSDWGIEDNDIYIRLLN